MPGRRQKCDSYLVFEKNLERSQAFLRIFDGFRIGPGQPPNDEKELLRGCVVLAIAALDSFLHELILEIVPRFGVTGDSLNPALRAIAKDDPGLSLRVALSDGRHRREEFKDALDSWLSSQSFQGPEAVVRAISYVGCTLSWQDLDKKFKGACAERLRHYTDMRHDIVHRGKGSRIQRAGAQEAINLVELIAKEINTEAVRRYH